MEGGEFQSERADGPVRPRGREVLCGAGHAPRPFLQLSIQNQPDEQPAGRSA